MPEPSRKVFGSREIESFYHRISLDSRYCYQSGDCSRLSADDQLQFLQVIQTHCLTSIPFENLSLHYSLKYSINLDPNALLDKIVNSGRGGYCMELNCLLGVVLHSIGFDVYSAGARVNESINPGVQSVSYHGWSHMVNIVKLPDKRRYMIDIAFGGGGPITPLLLQHEVEAEGIAESHHRLLYESIAENTDGDQRLWVCQRSSRIGSSTDRRWNLIYAFTELEFLPTDFEVMNFWTSQNPGSLFKKTIVMAKYTQDKQGAINGMLSLFGPLYKKTVDGIVVAEKEMRTEQERLHLLANVFGVVLDDIEVCGIRGLSTELPSIS